MMKLRAADFYRVTSNIAEMNGIMKGSSGIKSEIIDRSIKNHLFTLSENMYEHLVTLGARVSASGAKRLANALKNGDLTTGDFCRMMDEVDARFFDELFEKKLLVLSDQEEKYLDPTRPIFGKEFVDKFPTQGVFELDEATKCMALGCPTAAVFHLMRIMEVGIKAFATCLGIPDPVKPAERNWGKMLENIDKAIKTRWPTTADRMNGDGALFESLYASFDAAKNPWRNGTMHVENKFTDSEAENMLAAVKGFMMKLASRMDENGEPKA